MQKLFLIFLVWGMGSLSVHSEPSEKAIAEASQAFLKKVVREFSRSPEASPYFVGASTSDIIPQRYAPLVNSPDGWAYLWHYEHDVKHVEDRETQSGQTVILGNDDPIIFEVHVVYKFGTGKLFSWSKHYSVLKNPELETGFYIKTKNHDTQIQLERKMDGLMKGNLIIFQKVLAGR